MDVDIDVANLSYEKIFPSSVRASIFNREKLTSHPCGLYFQDMPTDPITGLAAIPYDQAEALGYFKIDILHVNIYDHFSSREEIKELLRYEPDWGLLSIPSVVAQLFQVSKHYDLIDQVKPSSILELADCLALIRPAKRFMLKKYLEDRKKIRPELYKLDNGDGYAFKRGHAISYAMVIILQLHLIKGGITF